MNTYIILMQMGKTSPCMKREKKQPEHKVEVPEPEEEMEGEEQHTDEPEYLRTSKRSIEEMDVTGYDKYSSEHGHHFTQELAEAVSAIMVNADGSSHTWTCEEVEEAFAKYGYKLPETATIGDACYLANMAYADFYPQLLTDRQCIKYAMLTLADPDGYEGMPFLRWVSDAIGKGLTIDWEEYV